jgi:hypothetical protein
MTDAEPIAYADKDQSTPTKVNNQLREYRRPRLKVYGSIAALTRSQGNDLFDGSLGTYQTTL